MALTEEQKDILRKDTRFMSVIKNRAATGGDLAELSVKDRIEKRRQNRIQKQETTVVDTTEGVAADETVEEPSKIGDFIKGAGKGLLSTARGGLSLAQKAFETPTRLLGIKTEEETAAEQLIPESAVTPESTAEKIGFGVEQVAEFFAPIPGARVAKGAAAATKAPRLAKAALTAAEVTGRTAAQTGELGTGEVATGALTPIIGGALTKAGETLFSQLPKRLIKSAIGQKPKALKAGQDVSEFVLEKKKFGTAQSIINGAQENIDKLDEGINKIINVIPVTKGKISPKQLFNDIAGKINEEGGEISIEEIKSIVTKLAPQAKALLNKPTMSIKSANQLRQSIDKTLGDRGFLTSQIPFNKGILRDFTNAVREEVKTKAPGTRSLFKDYSSEIRLRDALSDKFESTSKQILGLTDFLAAGVGAGGGIPGAIATLAGKKAVQSTPFLTGLGISLDQLKKAAPILEKLEPAERGILSQIIQKLFESNRDQEE